jgi:hypothetical protein
MGLSSFAARTVEHTFTTGRTAVVKEALNYTWLMIRIKREDPELAVFLQSLKDRGEVVDEDGEQPDDLQGIQLVSLLLAETVVQPRIVLPGDLSPDGTEYPDMDGESYGEGWVWLPDFTDDEQAEIIDLAVQGVRLAATFPGDAGGDDGGARREVLEGKPRKSSGSAKRKR